MAGLAGLREIAGHVVRVRGFLEIRQVATRTRRRCSFKLSSDMAGGAIQCRVRPGQSETCRQMVKLCPQPTIHAVTILTRGRESAGHMAGLGRLIILGVARITLSRQSLELADRGPGMAGGAIERGVRSHQWKTVLVLLDLLYRHLPSLHRMALLTRRPKLPLVNVSVAVGAFLANISEYRFGVALSAGHALVHSTQRKAGLIVVEFRDGADGLPPAHGVAVLAGNA